ncbi:hypothetical protein [Salibacterium sp. K-3]
MHRIDWEMSRIDRENNHHRGNRSRNERINAIKLGVDTKTRPLQRGNSRGL